MLLRQVLTISFCGTSMAVCSLASAEQQAQPAQQAQPQVQQVQPGQNRAAQQAPGQVGQRTQWMNSDQTLATCIAIANQEEVSIAKFAEEKTRNDDVKQFAKMMVKDHQAFLQKLQKFAPEASREGYLNENSQSMVSSGQQRLFVQRVVPLSRGRFNKRQQPSKTSKADSLSISSAYIEKSPRNASDQPRRKWARRTATSSMNATSAIRSLLTKR